MDCGPAELHFSITDPELLTNTTRELNRLRENKAKLEMQLHELQKVVAGLLAFCGSETGRWWGVSQAVDSAPSLGVPQGFAVPVAQAGVVPACLLGGDSMSKQSPHCFNPAA